MVTIYTGIILPIISYATLHQGHTISIPGFCNVGNVAENECNKCVCSLYHVFECQPKPCNQTDVAIKTKQSFCIPGMFYVRNSTVCLCDKNGSWPHDNCTNIFKALPTITNKDDCEPNTYMIIDCNVCKCNTNGKIDMEHCTKNECRETNKTVDRRFIKENQVYGSCEAQNWYSLAPCQFCFCISENKLVCNTGQNYSQRLQLGSYNLSICGKDLLKDAIGLVPDKDTKLRLGEKVNKTLAAAKIDRNKTAPVKVKQEASIEVNRENNEKESQPQRIKKINESEEYYTEDSDENAKTSIPIGREGSSTKLPYEEDDNDGSEDAESGNEMSVGIHLQNTPQIVTEPELPASAVEAFAQNIEWKPSPPNREHQPKEMLSLGDVLKPYLPVVLDKVFQMALRKSMVSVEPHSNCTPGDTTVVKCNACFCMKNNKLLCTNNPCH